MNFKPGDKVRMVRLPKLEYDEGFVALPEKYRTKELTVTKYDHSGVIFFEEIALGALGEYSDCFIPSNAVIHTKTQKEYDRLMESLEDVGYRWLSGSQPTGYNEWRYYEKETIIEVKGRLGFGHREHAIKEGRPIIPFTDIFPEEKTDRVETFAYEYNYEPNNKRTMLQKLSNAMERKLNSNTKALYRAGFIRDDLELTEEGKRALIDILAVEYETKLANKAREVIEEEDNK